MGSKRSGAPILIEGPQCPALPRSILLGHALYEVRAFLLTRCANYPQAPRLARVVEMAVDELIVKRQRVKSED